MDEDTGGLIGDFVLKPDILDLGNNTVYEVKSLKQAPFGKAQVLSYLAALNLRYPGRIFTPGRWNPEAKTYNIFGLPGLVGIPVITIEAFNYGFGVIAWDFVGVPEWIPVFVAIGELVARGIQIYNARVAQEFAARPAFALLGF